MPNLQTTDSSSGLNLWTKNHPVFLRHLIIWVIYSIYQQSIVFYVTKGKVFDIYSFLLNSVLDAFIFYASFYIFQHFLKPKKYVSVFIGLLALIAAFSGIKYGFEKIIFPCAGIQVADVFSADINKYVAANIWNTILYSGYGLGYFYALKAIQAEKDQRLLETEKRILIESELFHTQEILLKNQEILEKTQKVLSQEHQLLENEQELKRLEYERNQAQLAFLRSQINPHFLYNTLNFFYAKVLSHSREAAEGILVLVEMMKYALKEEDGNGKVMLDKEVQHLENFIKLNQLRYNNTLFIRFNKDGMLAFRTIMPLVLITFVENIIKHGDLQDIENPAVIDMKVNNQGLLFFTHNKKRNGPKEKSTGIGLQNTINRLNLGYGNDGYHLEIDETDLFYTVNLRIKI